MDRAEIERNLGLLGQKLVDMEAIGGVYSSEGLL